MKKSLTFIFAAALLVSCQQEENETLTPANSRITISPVITRATEVNFETGDKIGVTIIQNDDFVYAENKQMTFNDRSRCMSRLHLRTVLLHFIRVGFHKIER